MTATVKISKANWRGFDFVNEVLPIVSPFKPSSTRGEDGFGTITVDASSVKKLPKIAGCDPMRVRLRVKESDIEQLGIEALESDADLKKISAVHNPSIPLDGDYNGETEEEAMRRINERFDILDEMSEAIAYGNVRSLIVSGPPGVGKSFGVEKVLREINGIQAMSQADLNFDVIKGSISPIGLYMKLFEYSDKDNVLVLDDSDEALLDPISLSLLKAALDTSNRRWLSWNKESHALRDSQVPDRFEFKGGMIFITNLDFINVKSKQLKPHLDALLSRSHYLNLEINSQRDKFLRIKGVVKSSGMLDDKNLSKKQNEEILNFVRDNVALLQELSLRTVLKIADLVKMKEGKSDPEDWKRIARTTLMKKSVI